MSTIDQDLLAAMYQADDELETSGSEGTTVSVPDRGIMNLAAVSAELRRLHRVVEEQSRRIRRLENRLRYAERRSNTNTTDAADLRRELDGKMDRF